MRINKFVAQATGMSRRAADKAVEGGWVAINGATAQVGSTAEDTDVVTLDGEVMAVQATNTTLMLNKPVGFVVSRDGQGSRTIYDLIPDNLHKLKPIGRLDKYSSGLLLMTTDGDLANELTHPSRQKQKVYVIRLNKQLAPLHRQMINDHGINLEDGVSKLTLQRHTEGSDWDWIITMHEGRNRQIRRTFEALGYTVTKLHRTNFGNYALGNLRAGSYELLLS